MHRASSASDASRPEQRAQRRLDVAHQQRRGDALARHVGHAEQPAASPAAARPRRARRSSRRRRGAPAGSSRPTRTRRAWAAPPGTGSSGCSRPAPVRARTACAPDLALVPGVLERHHGLRHDARAELAVGLRVDAPARAARPPRRTRTCAGRRARETRGPGAAPAGAANRQLWIRSSTTTTVGHLVEFRRATAAAQVSAVPFCRTTSGCLAMGRHHGVAARRPLPRQRQSQAGAPLPSGPSAADSARTSSSSVASSWIFWSRRVLRRCTSRCARALAMPDGRQPGQRLEEGRPRSGPKVPPSGGAASASTPERRRRRRRWARTRPGRHPAPSPRRRAPRARGAGTRARARRASGQPSCVATTPPRGHEPPHRRAQQVLQQFVEVERGVEELRRFEQRLEVRDVERALWHGRPLRCTVREALHHAEAVVCAGTIS